MRKAATRFYHRNYRMKRQCLPRNAVLVVNDEKDVGHLLCMCEPAIGTLLSTVKLRAFVGELRRRSTACLR